MRELAFAEQDDVLWIRVGKIFDVPEAWRVRDAVASCANRALVLDFRPTSEFHDFAMAALLTALTKIDHPPLTAVGLGAHQRAILRYLGCDPGTFEPLCNASGAPASA